MILPKPINNSKEGGAPSARGGDFAGGADNVGKVSDVLTDAKEVGDSDRRLERDSCVLCWSGALYSTH